MLLDPNTIRAAKGPGRLQLEMIVRYAADYHDDLRESFPAFGFGAAGSDAPVPGIMLYSDGDGISRVYVLEPEMLSFLRAHIGVPPELLDALAAVLTDHETEVEATAARNRARALLEELRPGDGPGDDG